MTIFEILWNDYEIQRNSAIATLYEDNPVESRETV